MSQEQIKAVVDALDKNGPMHTKELMRECQGITLSTLYNVLAILGDRKLVTRGRCNVDGHRRVLFERTELQLEAPPAPSIIPPYHPLDALFGRYA